MVYSGPRLKAEPTAAANCLIFSGFTTAVNFQVCLHIPLGAARAQSKMVLTLSKATFSSVKLRQVRRSKIALIISFIYTSKSKKIFLFLWKLLLYWFHANKCRHGFFGRHHQGIGQRKTDSLGTGQDRKKVTLNL